MILCARARPQCFCPDDSYESLLAPLQVALLEGHPESGLDEASSGGGSGADSGHQHVRAGPGQAEPRQIKGGN